MPPDVYPNGDKCHYKKEKETLACTLESKGKRLNLQGNNSELALLIVAHGSRNPEANEELLALCVKLRSRFPVVEPAFLEIASPGIPQAGENCAAKGASQVVIVPYFLSPGVHVSEDLETARKELASSFPTVEFILAGPIGLHPMVEQILIDRVHEAIQSRTD